MRKTFKMVRLKDRIFIYPHPVIKEKKYLIEVLDEIKANEIIAKIETGSIPSPDENLNDLDEVEVHTDGRTKIYKFKD